MEIKSLRFRHDDIQRSRWAGALGILVAFMINELPAFPRTSPARGAPDRVFTPPLMGVFSTHAAYYAHALASVGRHEDAADVRRWALRLADRMPKATLQYIQARHHLRLLVLASRGEKETALAELEAMVDSGWRWLMSPGNLDFPVYSVGLGWFEDSPLLDSIREEPRFIAALDRVKADNAAMLAELNAGPTLADIVDEEID